MTGIKNILLLAGSAEARVIAVQLQGRDLPVQVLISEPPRGPNPMPISPRLFDFTGLASLEAVMSECDAVLDASHGFDALMTQAGFAIARRLGKPFLSLRRPSWDVSESPLWQSAPDVTCAVQMIPAGARVFAATGWPSLEDYAQFPGAKLLVRQSVPHDKPPPFAFMEFIFDPPPFSQASEVALFKRLGVELLICRNLGGLPSRPKLDAAKALKLPVILIDKPPLPPGVAFVEGVSAALAWVDQE